MSPTGGQIVRVAREGGASSRAIKPADQTLSNNGEHLNVGSLSETATSIKQIQTEQIKVLTSNVLSVDEWRGETLCTAAFQNGRTTSNALKKTSQQTLFCHISAEMESEVKSGFVIYSGCWKRWRLITRQHTKHRDFISLGGGWWSLPRWAKTSQKDVFSMLTAEFAGFKLRVLQCNFSQKHLKNVLWFKIKSFRMTTLHSMQQKLQTGLETVVSNIYFFIDTFQISKTNWRHSVKGAWCAGAEHCSSGSPVCNRLAYLK